jgi:hypothetical protein
MGKSDSVPGTVDRLNDGDPVGIDELFTPFAGRLTRIAEAHLSRRAAGRDDDEAVVRSVFRREAVARAWDCQRLKAAGDTSV